MAGGVSDTIYVSLYHITVVDRAFYTPYVRMDTLYLPLVPLGHSSSLPTSSYSVSNQTHLIKLTSKLKDAARAGKHRKEAPVFFQKYICLENLSINYSEPRYPPS